MTAMPTTDEPLVLRSDRADGLTTLTLNRPGQFNSLSKDMLTALQAELDARRRSSDNQTRQTVDQLTVSSRARARLTA
mgnify:CR=1 FL=1